MGNSKFKWDEPTGAVQPANIYVFYMSSPVFRGSFQKQSVLVFPRTILLWTKSIWEIANRSQKSQEIKAHNFQMNA